MSSRHNSAPEINVLSRLKFSKSVFPHLMLIWAKRNQLVLLEDAASICSSTLAPSAPPTFSTFPVLLHSYIQTNHRTGSKSYSLPPAYSTPAPRLVYDGASGLNIALQLCSRTEAVLCTIKAMPFLMQIQGVCKSIHTNAEKIKPPINFPAGSVASEEKTWSASQDYSSP